MVVNAGIGGVTIQPAGFTRSTTFCGFMAAVVILTAGGGNGLFPDPERMGAKFSKPFQSQGLNMP